MIYSSVLVNDDFRVFQRGMVDLKVLSTINDEDTNDSLADTAVVKLLSDVSALLRCLSIATSLLIIMLQISTTVFNVNCQLLVIIIVIRC